VTEATCSEAFNENNIEKNRYKDMIPCKKAVDIHYKCDSTE